MAIAIPALLVAADALADAVVFVGSAALVALGIHKAGEALNKELSDAPPSAVQSCPLQRARDDILMSEVHSDEQHAQDIVDSGTQDCDAIIEAIQGLIKALRFRYEDMADHGGGDPGHIERYNKMRELLKQLLAMASANECNLNPQEAQDWVNQEPP
jgi:hypothetical protein